VEEAIPKLIDDTTNNILTMLPTMEEVKNVVFGLNSDGAPGPDGFRACFFQSFWEIINNDVFDAVIEFFNTERLPPNYN